MSPSQPSHWDITETEVIFSLRGIKNTLCALLSVHSFQNFIIIGRVVSEEFGYKDTRILYLLQRKFSR